MTGTQLSNTTNELQLITRLLLLLSPAPGSAAPDEADGDTMNLVTGQWSGVGAAFSAGGGLHNCITLLMYHIQVPYQVPAN